MEEILKYDLPSNWILTSIGEVSIIQSGGTPDRKNYNFYNGTIPWGKSGELNYNT
jgi:type I restriction enzyme S subunit